MKHMILGVSTRNYDGLLDEVSGGTGLSKSSLSAAFVKSSQTALDEINSRDLSGHEFIAIMIDGIGFGDRLVIAGAGYYHQGQEDDYWAQRRGHRKLRSLQRSSAIIL